jgi:hypothetical protein
MATPNIKIQLKPVNNLTLKNEEVTEQDFVLKKLKNDGSDFELYSTTTVYTVDASDEYLFENLPDNLYQLAFFDTSTNEEVYVYALLDHNIKVCEKSLLKTILCVPAKDCNTKAYYKLLEKRQKFYVLKSQLYAVYGQYVGELYRNGVAADFNVVTSNFRVYLDALSAMCGCLTPKVDNCTSGELPQTNWTNLSSSDCGCS